MDIVPVTQMVESRAQDDGEAVWLTFGLLDQEPVTFAFPYQLVPKVMAGLSNAAERCSANRMVRFGTGRSADIALGLTPFAMNSYEVSEGINDSNGAPAVFLRGHTVQGFSLDFALTPELAREIGENLIRAASGK